MLSGQGPQGANMLRRWTDRVPPLAELLILGGLFWGIVCGNGASEVAGGVLDGFSWNEALRIATRNEALFANRTVPSNADLGSSVEGMQLGRYSLAELLVDHEQGCNQCEQQLYLSLLDFEEDPASHLD